MPIEDSPSCPEHRWIGYRLIFCDGNHFSVDIDGLTGHRPRETVVHHGEIPDRDGGILSISWTTSD